MKNNAITLKQLDQQLARLKEQTAYARPEQGWVRSIRKAFGMTIKQLAKRLKVDPSRIVKIETSEIKGAVTLRTMQSVAESFDCTFVYSFVPNSTLIETVTAQAKKMATAHVLRMNDNLHLNAQDIQETWLLDQIEDETNDLLKGSWKHLWEK